MQIPHNVGREIQRHPCLFWPIDPVRIVIKPGSIDEGEVV